MIQVGDYLVWMDCKYAFQHHHRITIGMTVEEDARYPRIKLMSTSHLIDAENTIDAGDGIHLVVLGRKEHMKA
jgi:hypothetical protein